MKTAAVKRDPRIEKIVDELRRRLLRLVREERRRALKDALAAVRVAIYARGPLNATEEFRRGVDCAADAVRDLKAVTRANFIVVLAGRHDQAMDWAVRHNLGPGEFRYAADELSLLGLRDFKFVVVGDHVERHGFRLIEAAEQRGGVRVA